MSANNNEDIEMDAENNEESANNEKNGKPSGPDKDPSEAEKGHDEKNEDHSDPDPDPDEEPSEEIKSKNDQPELSCEGCKDKLNTRYELNMHNCIDHNRDWTSNNWSPTKSHHLQ